MSQSSSGIGCADMLRLMVAEVRRRRRGMTAAMYEYAKKHGGEFSIPEVTQAIESDFPNPAKSSIRSCLQNERYFERIRPGVFRAV